MQPDTLIPDPTNPQAWNRFSYVGNRPVNFNDPTGHVECEPGTSGCHPPGSNGSGGGSYGNTTFPDPGDIDDDNHHHGHHDDNDDPADELEIVEDIPDFDTWVNICSSNPFGAGCPQPPEDLGCTAPDMIAGQNSTEFGCHIDHYETVYNWSELDYWSVGFNGLSIIGNVVLAVGVFGTFGLGIEPAFVIYSVTQVASFAYDVIAADNILEPISLQLVTNYAPGFSLAINVATIQNDIADIKHEVPIYIPDMPYLGPVKKLDPFVPYIAP